MYDLIETILLSTIGRTKLVNTIIMYMSPIPGLAFGITFSVFFAILFLLDARTYKHMFELYDENTKKTLKAFSEVQLTCAMIRKQMHNERHIRNVVNAKDKIKGMFHE